tara:strand:- start:363 stop:647 length:285 start_codon:yes stop_codon:yes gene_type:complete
MIKIIEKATFKFEKVLLVDLLDDYKCNDKTEYEEIWRGGYAIYTYDEYGDWTKQEYIKYDGLVDDPKGWGNVYDSVALPRFKDYCLAMLSEMEE